MDEPAMILRRAAVAALGLSVALAQLAWLRAILAGIGWGPATLALMLCAIVVAPCLGLAAANAAAGFLIRMLAHDPPAAVLAGLWSDEDAVTTPTAILMRVDGQELGPVLETIERLLDGLDASRWGDRFQAFVLSETPDGPTAEAERLAVSERPRIGYRRRPAGRAGRPVSLVAFLDELEGFEFAVVLGAGSTITAETVLRLVRILQARRDLGIVQHLWVGLPAALPFARLLQFGGRARQRIWATGQGWWQGDAGVYCGHHAALRIAAFREGAGAAVVRAGTAVPAHPQVDASYLRAAHWGVMVWPDSRGAYELSPSTIVAFEQRDADRLRSIWPYRDLLVRRGLLPMGRWQLWQAVMPFALAPCCLAGAALAAALAWRGVSAPGALGLLYVAALTVHAPTWLGYAELLVRPRARARYGGASALWKAIAAQTAFALLLAPVTAASRSLALLTGGHSSLPPGRDPQRVGIVEAALRFLPHTVLGVLLGAGFAHAGWSTVFVAPFLAGLPLAIPFAVLTASPGLGRLLARRAIAAMPEERADPS
ncbi:MAG: glucans biosynthesis glucosyltransferase MdoH [Rhodospirillales bacterium]|nr:glucans biosynthesis glucosyltransferase MdoH [Rhodospirillales bacterium]